MADDSSDDESLPPRIPEEPEDEELFLAWKQKLVMEEEDPHEFEKSLIAAGRDEDEEEDEEEDGRGRRAAGRNKEEREELFDWDGFAQLKELQQQNSALLVQVDRLERRNEELQNAKEALQPGAGGGTLQQAQQSRIIELAKKNRNLTVSLEREKSKVAKLLSEIRQLKRQRGAEAKASASEAGGKASDGSASSRGIRGKEKDQKATASLEAEMKVWKDKYESAMGRLSDARQTNHMLKNELTRAQKALIMEVGEDVDIRRVLDEGGNWRGRAQQILTLKQKVKELQRIANAEGSPAAVPSTAASSDAVAADAGVHPREQMHRQGLKYVELEKRKEIEALQDELVDTQQREKELKTQAKALTSRNKVLEEDIRSLRSKIQILVQKSDDDDRLVDAQRAEIIKMRRDFDRSTSKIQPVVSEQSKELESLRSVCAQQAAQVERQEKIILSLRNELAASSRRASDTHAKSMQVMADTIDKSALSQRARMLEVELEKAEELLAMTKKDKARAQAELDSVVADIRGERQKRAELERKLGHAQKTGVPSSGGGGGGGKIQQLSDRVQNLQEENNYLRHRLEAETNAFEQELGRQKDVIHRQRIEFDEAIAVLRTQVESQR